MAARLVCASLARVVRMYVPYKEKHKWPKGFGSLCPSMPPHEPDELLKKAIVVPGGGRQQIVDGKWSVVLLRAPVASRGPRGMAWFSGDRWRRR